MKYNKYHTFLSLIGTVPIPTTLLAEDVGCRKHTLDNYVMQARKDGLTVIKNTKRKTIKTTSDSLKMIREMLRDMPKEQS